LPDALLSIIATAASILALLGGIHFYWALGGHRGLALAIPWDDGRLLFHPRRVPTFAIGLALITASAILVMRIAPVPWPPAGVLSDVMCWFLALLFLGRAVGDFRYVGLFKRLKASSFARLDTFVYVPLCLFLSLASALGACANAV
jgi:hypothetical protein